MRRSSKNLSNSYKIPTHPTAKCRNPTCTAKATALKGGFSAQGEQSRLLSANQAEARQALSDNSTSENISPHQPAPYRTTLPELNLTSLYHIDEPHHALQTPAKR